MSLPALDTITGVLLIGTWANSLLYAAELAQAIHYFRHFWRDDWKLKTLVAVAFFIDTVSTLGDYACVYLYTVTHAGDPVYLSQGHWPLSLYLFTTAIVAVLVQSFLIHRYWRYTENNLVSLVLVFLTIAALGGTYACGVIIVLFPAVNERDRVKIPALIWLVTEAVADLGIAAALLWELRDSRPASKNMRSFMNRLVAVTIQTGTGTATLALAALIGYLLKEESNVPGGITYTLGRAYVLCMLANLNLRSSNRTCCGTSTGVLWGPRTSSMGGTFNIPTGGTDDLSGLHLHPSVHIGSRQDIPVATSKSLADDSPPVEIEMVLRDKRLSRQESGLFAV
ncbi:hypothetical protein GGX14DRAFT_558131 [Mycena pura]|uniref:DUF6534 domain-containing protein n=1 Tax=Mycena pura TaxID=153505 RepID=A0AAD7E1J0_9AGAR|nr:hypothetical protein GGX14DRAFT_558131 [Mycena pura]